MQKQGKREITTAYTSQQANIYDQSRFTKPQGVCVHQREWTTLRTTLHLVKKEGRVLEVGCGTGRLLVEVQRLGYHVDGADASPDMLDKLKEKLGPDGSDTSFWIAPADKLPCSNASYDLTYAIRLLNQTESPEYALGVVGEMIRVTKPSGYVLVEFVNEWRPRWGMGKRKTTRLKPSEVAKAGIASGASPMAYYGNFFLSMQAFHYSPAFLLPLVNGLDKLFSVLFPRFCSRCYVLFKKDAT